MKCQVSFVSPSLVCKTGTGEIKCVLLSSQHEREIENPGEGGCLALGKSQLTKFNKNPQSLFSVGKENYKMETACELMPGPHLKHLCFRNAGKHF